MVHHLLDLSMSQHQAGEHHGNLSQICSKPDDHSSSGDEIINIDKTEPKSGQKTIETNPQPGEESIGIRPESKDTVEIESISDHPKREIQSDSDMTANDDFEQFSRPRSFSDISLSSGKYSLPRQVKDGGPVRGKTSMQVIVQRKTQKVIKSLDFDTDEGIDHGIRPRADTVSGGSIGRARGAKVFSVVDIQGQSPPPKPALPKNYVPKSYFSHELQKQKCRDGSDSTRIRHSDLIVTDKAHHDIESRPRSVHNVGMSSGSGVSHSRPGSKHDTRTNSSLDRGVSDVRQTNRPHTHAQSQPKLLPQRSSDPDVRAKTYNIVFRHHDAQMQSDLLKKELNTLSKSKHVRRKSETMRQRLMSEETQQPANVDTKSTRKQSVSGAESGGAMFKPVLMKQSKSVDQSSYRSDVKSGQHSDDLWYKGGYYGEHNNSKTDELRIRSAQTSHIQDRSVDTRETRRPSNDRAQTQVRSKSASSLSRNLDRNQLENNLASDMKNTNLSKSVSNLRRKHDTIRKFNNTTVAQHRDNVRIKYQIFGAREECNEDDDNTADPVSPGHGTNVAQVNLRLTDAKQSKSVGDNRSDEEKYAALSRDKILHNKSSSYDSPAKKQSPRRIIPNHLSLERMKEIKRGKLGALDFTKSDESGNRQRRTGARAAPVESEASVSDSECVMNKGAAFSSGTLSEQKSLDSLGTKVVLRQCRVGDGIAFGLVRVKKQTDALKEETKKPNGNGFLDGQGLVTIRMIPDEQGRFGFNVKGGVDQGMPIIVSRVAPNTPADNAIPRLNEGDQVLFINGRDVSQHTHEQVVMFIRASRETHSGELVLKVRPNAYSGDDQSEEPDFVYDPETHQISSASSGANALEMSLKLLEESLESGAALAQFEQLYRKKPGMTMNTARLEINVNKNRYRDISPYDQTRVILKSSNGDYINANYVNMEIPVSGIVNRYIAAQGPLPTTCTDFWQMIWEQQSTLVIMLTTKVERGRVKCHQYWPDLYETSDYGHLQITCVKEEESPSFAFREFNLTQVESQEERHISHMQYIAWPDHGVPDDPSDFLDFVIKVRQKRVGLVEPSVVHCSAGIGRTGVLITMETAMCLIEANQPVYPLSIVRQMRDQRAMLIQTPNQYKFVCEAIIRCFQEGIVKPLPEYQQR